MDANGRPETLLEAINFFSDPDVCQDFMVTLRWPNGVVCPTCGSRDVGYVASRRVWNCRNKHPRKQFSIKVGTIFEDSPIPLEKWLPAMWLIANDKNGISSYEVGRALGVTQKSAWFMMHRVRLAMQDETSEPFGGEVEVDETFIGGKARFMHQDKRAEKITGRGGVDKASVMGLLARHGLDGHSVVRTEVVANTRRKTLDPKVRQQVRPGSEVFTDALKSYDGLDGEYIHQVIDHAEAYARGNVHTNGLENFWSLLKRAIRGSYVNVEPFHLFRYLDEQSFRFNNRKVEDADRFEMVSGSVVGKRLTYKRLIGAPATTPG